MRRHLAGKLWFDKPGFAGCSVCGPLWKIPVWYARRGFECVRQAWLVEVGAACSGQVNQGISWITYGSRGSVDQVMLCSNAAHGLVLTQLKDKAHHLMGCALSYIA